MSIVDVPLTYTKDELLAALAERRKKAEKVDAKNLAAHRKAEQKYLADFRKACREALKWDYETLKQNGNYIAIGGKRVDRWAPQCPASEVSRIDSLIAMVQKINQPRFTLNRNGRWGPIYRFLVEDVPEIKGLC